MKKSLKKLSLIINFTFMLCLTFHTVSVNAQPKIIGSSSIKPPEKVIYKKPPTVHKTVQQTAESPEKKVAAVKPKPNTSTKPNTPVKASTSKKASASKKAAAQKKSKTTPAKSQNKPKSSYQVASRGSGTALGAGNPQKVVSYAKEFLGIKYLYGGMSPNGFDCSGFTSYVYKAFGINLPRTASGQAGTGLSVSKDNLVPGDLVFFETYTKGISHVGIYVGNGQFIHASSSKGITITSLSDSYYLTRYRGATRILK